MEALNVANYIDLFLEGAGQKAQILTRLAQRRKGLQVLVGSHTRAKKVLVAVGARWDNAQTCHVEHLIKERHRPRRISIS